MKRGNHSKSGFPKALVLVMAMVLLVGAAIGGTVAWLTAQTPAVTNTFTSGKLFVNPETQFTLLESKAEQNEDGTYTLDPDNKVTENAYSILPGVDIPKDPTITVTDLAESAYLYVKVTDTLVDGLTYAMDSAWTQIAEGSDVWVYEKDGSNVITASNSSKVSFTANILADTKIEVADDYSGADNAGSLIFQAYMVQATGNGSDAATAWANTYGTP